MDHTAALAGKAKPIPMTAVALASTSRCRSLFVIVSSLVVAAFPFDQEGTEANFFVSLSLPFVQRCRSRAGMPIRPVGRYRIVNT